MPTIQILSDNPEFMETLRADLTRELQEAGIGDDLEVSEAKVAPSDGDTNTRGDMFSVMQVIAIAAGAGGALTVSLSKDGFLTTLARVLEKYIEGRQAQVMIEKDDGEKIQLSGPIGEVKEILQDLKE